MPTLAVDMSAFEPKHDLLFSRSAWKPACLGRFLAQADADGVRLGTGQALQSTSNDHGSSILIGGDVGMPTPIAASSPPRISSSWCGHNRIEAQIARRAIVGVTAALFIA